MSHNISSYEKNYTYNIVNYKKLFSSSHWDYNNNKKKNLFLYKNLKNFRRNGLSYGLDDQFYSKKETLLFLNYLIKECGKEFIYKLLDKKNIGNARQFIKIKSKSVTANELFHIKFAYDLQNKIALNNKNIICEIGPGYGSLIAKLKKIFHSKIILIDLPEANFINSYYLKSIFPKKNFFLSNDIKNNNITKKNIYENDIIILCPWEKMPNVKIDLFINTRSMMEMDYKMIGRYFDFIQNYLKIGGHFLCANRYYKDTVGYPIEFIKYPYDNKWEVVISKSSWFQNHIHFLLTKRLRYPTNDINKIMIEISSISEKLRKKDVFFWRRNLPNNVYKLYKRLKFFLKSIIE